jgi:hypothetical protein
MLGPFRQAVVAKIALLLPPFDPMRVNRCRTLYFPVVLVLIAYRFSAQN